METVLTQAKARTCGFFDFLSRIIVVTLLLFAVCIFLSINAHADIKVLQDCWANKKELVTIGLPRRHRGLAILPHPSKTGSDEANAQDNVCPAFIFGNEYDILDWLENGKIDAALLSPFVAKLLLRNTDLIIPSEKLSRKMPKPFGMSTYWPFTRAQLPSYHVGIQVLDSEGTYQKFTDAYDELIKEINDPKKDPKQQVFVDSYLSVDFPLLLDYTEHRFKKLGLGEKDSKKNKEFWFRFLESIKFRNEGFGPSPKIGDILVKHLPMTDSPKIPDSIRLLSGTAPIQDVFVYKKRFQKKLFAGDDFDSNYKIDWISQTIENWLNNKKSKNTKLDKGLLYIMETTYAVREEGFRKHRDFRFKLDELWSFLGARQDDDQFALILTGGGVKAAYQTSLIDHLYGKNYLTNTTERNDASSKSIKVDHLIGTSGGALLGAFVKDIGDKSGSKSPELVNNIWTTNKEGEQRTFIDNFDVFPFLDMPRYLSLILSMLLFSFLLEFVKYIPWFKNRIKIASLSAKHQIQEPLNTFIPPQLLWIALLLLSPWIIKSVNGSKGFEHVPAVAGVFYFIYILVATWSDNRLLFKQNFSWRNFGFKGKNRVMFITGIILAFVPFAMSLISGFDLFLWELPSMWSMQGLGEFHPGTFICCTGILMILFSTHIAFAYACGGVKNTEMFDSLILAKGFSIMLLVPIVSTIMVYFTGKSLFELSTEFWFFFALWTFVATALLLVIGYFPWKNNLVKSFVRDGLDFLYADFPNTTFTLRLKRCQRLTVFAVLAFFYWNIVMAPAIYGNDDAKEYFKKTYLKIVFKGDCSDDSSTEKCKGFLEKPLSNPPKTNFVVSATSIEEKKERYFLFYPKMLNDSSGREDPLEKTGLDTDPRWISADSKVTHQKFLDILFASGSPFPIFPATNAGFTKKDKEWLVDGGYAHNVPIEAAGAMGAQRVLIISSSPRHQHEEQLKFDELWSWGSLIRNAYRLFPYFFERSQVEDKMSAEEMLVATISPVHRECSLMQQEECWPDLIDFKSEVVEKLLIWAKEDKNARIGMMESWGDPVCEIGEIRYTCQELKTLKNLNMPTRFKQLPQELH